jgi:hypothetical protein
MPATGIITLILAVGMIMFLYGIGAFWIAKKKEEKLLFVLVAILGALLIIGFVCTVVEIPKGNIGIDQNGNWYSSGIHITLEKIQVVPLKGSVPLWNNAELLYDLTPEEVMSLERGSNFQEKLRSDTVVSIHELDVGIDETSRGIDKSHLKVLISF